MVGTSYNTAILQREHFVWRPSLWFTKGEPRVLEEEILCENLFVWFTVQRKRLASSFNFWVGNVKTHGREVRINFL